MRIKNNLLKEYNDEVILVLLVAAALTFILYALYYSNVPADSHSFYNFFEWSYSSIITLLSYSELQNKILLFAFFVILPIGVYAFCLGFIIRYLLKVNQLLSGVYLKSVNLHKDYIVFEYSKSLQNIVCNFDSIRRVFLDISVQSMHVPSTSSVSSSGYKISKITFNFEKMDGTTLSIVTTPFPLYVTSFIFRVVDYCKKNRINFECDFKCDDGRKTSITENFKKEIDNYVQYGSPKLTDNDKFAVVFFSTLLYLLSLFLILYFKDDFAKLLSNMCFIVVLLPVLAFVILDVYFLFDKNKYKEDVSNNKIIKYYGSLFLFKILLLIAVILMLFL